MKYLILIFWTFLSSYSMTGKVVKVLDGDTIVILLSGNKQERIRLLDIDAPEKGQPFGDKSKQYLSDMVAGKTVRIEYKERDQYGRILGTVFVDGKIVNEEMVKVGLAWQYYYSKNKRFAEFEAEAKRKRLNIFSDPNAINPYLYRRGIK